MKVVILAGGQGSRLLEETRYRPKPLVKIGEHPILWHVMQHYARFGHNDFLIALGHGSRDIKQYFTEALQLEGDIKLDFGSGQIEQQRMSALDWTVELVETGRNTATGGRLRRLEQRLRKRFLLTWSDGLTDLDLDALVLFHESHGKLATVTAVRPPARFGRLTLDGDQVSSFAEKPVAEEGWINGAFFVLEPEVLNYIDDDESVWEREPMERLVEKGQLMAYRHQGFWQCMDTLREKQIMERLWSSPKCPWRI